ncbi:HYC_CC_PP family protein [Flavitalea flava]
MKKVFATILAIIYLSTSMGATVHLHYCMGKLFSWGLLNEDKKDCGQCGMPKNSADGRCMAVKGGCCKDKQTVVKLDKDQKTTESAYTLFTASPDQLLGNLVNLPDRCVSSLLVDHPTTNAPPDPDKVPLFIRNCHFRI